MDTERLIYSYINYRSFLKDSFQKQKEAGKAFSQRIIHELMGVTSSGFLANVLSGRSDLTLPQADCLGNILGLSKPEQRYFRELVLFEKAKILSEKTRHFDILKSLRARKIERLSASELSLFSVWYYPIVRELLNFFEFKGDFKSLGKMLSPKITALQAGEAVTFLEENGFIRKNEQGVYTQVHQALSTGPGVDSSAVNRFQLKLIELAKEAFETVPSDKRDVSGVTITISDSSYARVKAAISDFRKQLIQIALEEQSPDQVYRCNLQLFPVTQKYAKNGGSHVQP